MVLSAGPGNSPTSSRNMERSIAPLDEHVEEPRRPPRRAHDPRECFILAEDCIHLRRGVSHRGEALQEVAEAPAGEAVLGRHLVPVVGERLHRCLVRRPADHLHELPVLQLVDDLPVGGRCVADRQRGAVFLHHDGPRSQVRGIGRGECRGFAPSLEHADPARRVLARLALPGDGDKERGIDGGRLDDRNHCPRLRRPGELPPEHDSVADGAPAAGGDQEDARQDQ